MHLPVSRKNQDTKELLAWQNIILQKAVVTIKYAWTAVCQKEAGVNKGMQIRWSVMIYSSNPPLKFRPESEIQAKIFLLHAKSKIWAQKMDESAIRCNCRIRNPEIRENIFAKSADSLAYPPPSKNNHRDLRGWEKIWVGVMGLNMDWRTLLVTGLLFSMQRQCTT